MSLSRMKIALLTMVAVLAIPLVVHGRAHGSDHADTPAIAADPDVDLSDVHIFPSPTNPNNVVLSMCVHPLITTAQVSSVNFSPDVLYQFKIDNVGDFTEHLVLQATFTGAGAAQQVHIGFGKPASAGLVTTALTPDSVAGTFNTPFTTSNGIKVFAGVREDPFFFDLDQFFAILPDRATPITHVYSNSPDTPQATTWRNPGVDFLSTNHFNVLAIVAEMPKSMLMGTNGGKIGVWCTTSILSTSRAAKILTAHQTGR